MMLNKRTTVMNYCENENDSTIRLQQGSYLSQSYQKKPDVAAKYISRLIKSHTKENDKKVLRSVIKKALICVLFLSYGGESTLLPALKARESWGSMGRRVLVPAPVPHPKVETFRRNRKQTAVTNIIDRQRMV